MSEAEDEVGEKNQHVGLSGSTATRLNNRLLLGE